MKDTEGEDTQREVQEEIDRRGSISGEGDALPRQADDEEMVTLDPAVLEDVNHPNKDANQFSTETNHSNKEDNHLKKDLNKELNQSKHKKSFKTQMREKSWFGKKCVKIFKIFTNAFGMTFLAEWGDRSQLATIVMAGINDVAGVCLGGILGHFICTGLAVICGALIAKKISVKMVTVVGAVVFIGFAIASLFIDPYDENQHVPMIEGDDRSIHNLTIIHDRNNSNSLYT